MKIKYDIRKRTTTPSTFVYLFSVLMAKQVIAFQKKASRLLADENGKCSRFVD